MKFNFIFIIICCSAIFLGNSQSLRSLNNEGVEFYKDGKYTDAEVNFRKGLEKDRKNYITNFNLGDTYYKQEKYDDALKVFQSLLPSAKTEEEKSRLYYNIGNTLLKSNKIEESIKAYKDALKLNPNDANARYNLSYALNLLKKNQNQKDKNKDEKQQNKDQNQQKKNDNNKQKDEQKKEQQNKNEQKDQNQNQQNQNQQKQNQYEQQMKKQEAERILEALKNNEKDLQKRLRKKVGVKVKTDKDW